MATNKCECSGEETSFPVVNPWLIFWINISYFLLPRNVMMGSQKEKEKTKKQNHTTE